VSLYAENREYGHDGAMLFRRKFSGSTMSDILKVPEKIFSAAEKFYKNFKF
jgi:hypothetical protein